MAYNDNPAYLKLSGGTMTGILTLSGDPSGANDAANKSYVDALSAGLNFKTSCVCATTANLNALYANGAAGVGATLTNLGALVAFTVDGITPTINQRVLVKNQTSEFQNGIYTITTLGTGAVAWILTRATDYDQASEINPGDIIPVSTGSTQANTNWLQTGFVATMGTDLITFQQYQSTPIQTTQYDVLVGGASNTIVSVGPGSAGQVLQSAGNASNPAYSTATYPATAGTSGNVLQSDGTNFVSTTPLIFTVAGQLLSSQIKALHGTPISAIATPGSGKFIQPMSLSLSYVYGGSNVFVAAASQTVGWYYASTTVISAGITNAVIVGTNSSLFTTNAPAISAGTPTNYVNQAVILYNPIATEISGNAANDNVINWSITYRIITA